MALSVSAGQELKPQCAEYDPVWIRGGGGCTSGDILWQPLFNNPGISQSLPLVHHPGTPCPAWSPTNHILAGQTRIKSLIWLQHGPQKAVRLCLLSSSCSHGVNTHRSLSVAVQWLVLPWPCSCSWQHKQGFRNVKRKNRQREVKAPMITAAMVWEAGDPAELSRDL